MICTQRFAFATKARQAVAPVVSQFNQCSLASDCTEKTGLQLGCSGNYFWLGNYVVRSDSQQGFVDAIADVASEICDDAPPTVSKCTMGGITLPHSVICDTDGRCGVKY